MNSLWYYYIYIYKCYTLVLLNKKKKEKRSFKRNYLFYIYKSSRLGNIAISFKLVWEIFNSVITLFYINIVIIKKGIINNQYFC